MYADQELENSVTSSLIEYATLLHKHKWHSIGSGWGCNTDWNMGNSRMLHNDISWALLPPVVPVRNYKSFSMQRQNNDRISAGTLLYWGRDSAVGIATRCGLDGPGIESRWGGARFSAPIQTGPGAHPASCTMRTGSLPGVKRPGRGADHPPLSKRRGHERVGLYLYAPSGPQWPVLGRTLLYFTLHFYVTDVSEIHGTTWLECSMHTAMKQSWI